MPDLKLDLYGDLDVTDGVASLTDDLSGETTAQLIRINLRLFLGEWFLDNRLGLDWFGKAFVKNPDLGAIRAMIRDGILAVTGVKAITAYSQSFDRQSRTLSVQFSVKDDLGNLIVINEVLGS